MDSNVVVAVRIRPLSQSELASGQKSCCQTIGNVVAIKKDGEAGQYLKSQQLSINEYGYDVVFDESCSQYDVYNGTAKSFIPKVLNGENVTIFAYGATGAGKTHTMLGNTRADHAAQRADAGIIPNSVHDLFSSIGTLSRSLQYGESYQVSFSYLEVYNEQVFDLLDATGKVLSVREDQERGIVVVAGITELQVEQYQSVIDLIVQGNRQRKTEATMANAVSSRSHAILQLTVRHVCRSSSGRETQIESKLSMIDLAGSERASATNNRGVRLQEGASINRSLLALANCINSLSEKAQNQLKGSSKALNVKYRDSKLTHLLKSSLEGNCNLVMIANVNPSDLTYEDSHNTLKYANRAKNIKVSPIVKESSKDSTWLEREHRLRDENKLLRETVDALRKEISELRAFQQRVLASGGMSVTDAAAATSSSSFSSSSLGNYADGLTELQDIAMSSTYACDSSNYTNNLKASSANTKLAVVSVAAPVASSMPTSNSTTSTSATTTSTATSTSGILRVKTRRATLLTATATAVSQVMATVSRLPATTSVSIAASAVPPSASASSSEEEVSAPLLLPVLHSSEEPDTTIAAGSRKRRMSHLPTAVSSARLTKRRSIACTSSSTSSIAGWVSVAEPETSLVVSPSISYDHAEKIKDDNNENDTDMFSNNKNVKDCNNNCEYDETAEVVEQPAAAGVVEVAVEEEVCADSEPASSAEDVIGDTENNDNTDIDKDNMDMDIDVAVEEQQETQLQMQMQSMEELESLGMAWQCLDSMDNMNSNVSENMDKHNDDDVKLQEVTEEDKHEQEHEDHFFVPQPATTTVSVTDTRQERLAQRRSLASTTRKRSIAQVNAMLDSLSKDVTGLIATRQSVCIQRTSSVSTSVSTSVSVSASVENTSSEAAPVAAKTAEQQQQLRQRRMTRSMASDSSHCDVAKENVVPFADLAAKPFDIGSNATLKAQTAATYNNNSAAAAGPSVMTRRRASLLASSQDNNSSEVLKPAVVSSSCSSGSVSGMSKGRRRMTMNNQAHNLAVTQQQASYLDI